MEVKYPEKSFLGLQADQENHCNNRSTSVYLIKKTKTMEDPGIVGGGVIKEYQQTVLDLKEPATLTLIKEL